MTELLIPNLNPVPDTTAEELERLIAAAHAARPAYGRYTPSQRRGLLSACAQAITTAGAELVEIAAAETHLTKSRLTGEIARTAYQLELYGTAIEDRRPTEIDPADPQAQPARPDLRLTYRPLGLVVVFAASNFPFAFGVAGTDTAAALAAGCPVLVKAHPGHPRTSARVAELLRRALAEHGAPDGLVGVVHGTDAGVAALRDARVAAAAFTGSLSGGRFLAGVAAGRSTPIPFYGELGSLNPVVVAPHAAEHRGSAITAAFVDSFTLGSGQFCTKPGVLLWPARVRLPDGLREQVAAVRPHPLLNEHIATGHTDTQQTLTALAGVEVLAAGGSGESSLHASLLLTTAAYAASQPEDVLRECFGPTALILTYQDQEEVRSVVSAIQGSLTATVHADDRDHEWVADILPGLEDCAGRVVWGGWPTGVAVAAAQHHGGPFPASTQPLHTSVGTHAIDRFLRPIAYQDFPQRFLPAELCDPWP